MFQNEMKSMGIKNNKILIRQCVTAVICLGIACLVANLHGTIITTENPYDLLWVSTWITLIVILGVSYISLGQNRKTIDITGIIFSSIFIWGSWFLAALTFWANSFGT